jgi:hypothetical protein
MCKSDMAPRHALLQTHPFNNLSASARSRWHRTMFASVDQGGNGLFDAVLESKTKKETVEVSLVCVSCCGAIQV